MADNQMVLFKKGLAANLPSTRDPKTLYFVTDEGKLYLGLDLIADKTGNYAAAITNAIGALDSTVKDENGLVKVTIVETDGKLTSVTVNQDALLQKFAEYQPKGNYKTTQEAVADKGLTGAKVLKNLSQNTNGDISYETRDLTPADIGAQPAGNYQPAGDYKTKQAVVTDPTADGNALTFIDSITQDTNGKISATKKNVDLSAYETKTQAEGKYAAKIYESKVDTLIDKDTGKSVRTIANEELAAQLLSGKADADFKTLQELAAWLEDHPEDVVEINEAIAAIQKDITDNRAKWETDTTYSADDETLTKSDANVFSVKDSGISTAKIADKAVTVDKLDTTIVTNITNGAEAHTTLTNGAVAISANGNAIKVSAFGKESDEFTVPYATSAESASYADNANSATSATFASNSDTANDAYKLGGKDPSYYEVSGTAATLIGSQQTGDSEATGVYAAIQGATTNTVRECVDAINKMNNIVDANGAALGNTIGTVENIVNQLTWGDFSK